MVLPKPQSYQKPPKDLSVPCFTSARESSDLLERFQSQGSMQEQRYHHKRHASRYQAQREKGRISALGPISGYQLYRFKAK